MTWRDEAACAGEDVALWFPDGHGDRIDLRARQLCHGCPVRGDCLAYAVDTGQQEGVWGGLTPSERQKWARRRRRRTA